MSKSSGRYACAARVIIAFILFKVGVQNWVCGKGGTNGYTAFYSILKSGSKADCDGFDALQGIPMSDADGYAAYSTRQQPVILWALSSKRCRYRSNK